MNVEDLYRLLRTGHVQAQAIVDTVPDPMLVLDENLCVLTASRSFFQTFKVDRYETIGQPVYELGNGQWDIPDLRLLLSRVIPRSAAVINFEVEHDFPDLGRRTMLLTARALFHSDNTSRSLLLSIVDVTESHRREAAKDMLFGVPHSSGVERTSMFYICSNSVAPESRPQIHRGVFTLCIGGGQGIALALEAA